MLSFRPFPLLLEKASHRGCMEAMRPQAFARAVPNAEDVAAPGSPGMTGWHYCLPAAVRVKELSCSGTWLCFRRMEPCWL